MTEVELVREVTISGVKIKPGARLVFGRVGTAEGFVRRGVAKRVDNKRTRRSKTTTSDQPVDTTVETTSDNRRSEANDSPVED